VKLRKLENRDAPLMMEWMHDPFIVSNMQTNFANKTLSDCEQFIKEAQNFSENIHLAITDDNGEYMGTVSLKNILSSDAEFAITMRKSAMGKGFAKFGMAEIIGIGLKKLGLKSVYWCVNPQNTRAIRFYDKNGYKKVGLGSLKNIKGYSEEQKKHYIWYQVIKD